MKLRGVVVACLAGSALAGCGGGGAGTGGPLALPQRVPNAADAPGTQADPVETRQLVYRFAAFVKEMGGDFVDPKPADGQAIRDARFVSAIRSTRFYPAQPGAGHAKSDAHIRAIVLRLGSEQGAAKAVEVVHRDALRPCPETCAAQLNEFDVPHIPGALGVRRYATPAAIEATGAGGDPFDSFQVYFADGVFAYDLDLFGPPGTVSEKQLDAIASKLYDRVHDAPATSLNGGTA